MHGNLKSLSIMLNLLREILLEDFPRMYGEQAEFEKDYKVILLRTEKEGISFLTKTLPSLGKSIDLALQGNPLHVSHFKLMGHTVVPQFLRVLSRRVFDDFGHLLPSPCITAVNDLRQITFLWYKLELPYAEEIQQETFNRFVDNDQFLRAPDRFLDGLDKGDLEILSTGRTLISSLFRGFTINDSKFTPKHGPGSVATGEKPFEKMFFKRFYRHLAEVFPYEEHFFLSPTHLVDHLDEFLSMEELDEGTSKVVLVPKDSRGPRLIAMEPLEYQWIQQGIKSKLYDFIEKNPMTCGHVNFTDQTINQKLALRSSQDQLFATLDMKDASDSVSLGLVKYLFGDIPESDLLEALLASRSSKAEVPDGRLVDLRKFAPMGSAVCFPIEAIVFWSLAVACLMCDCKYTRKQAVSSVYVYGDDIILPTDCVHSVFRRFPIYDLRFNPAKCCVSGYFRESCGVDAFHGEDITPLKIRKIFPSKQTDGTAIASYVDYSNQLWRKGFYSASKYLEKKLVELLGELPYGKFLEEGFGYPTPVLQYRVGGDFKQKIRRRWNFKLHRYEYLCITVRPVDYIGSPDTWREIFRIMIYNSEEIRAGRYSLPRKTKTQKRFVFLAPLCEEKAFPTGPKCRRKV